MAELNISPNTLKAVREKLQEKNVILFDQKTGNPNVKYEFTLHKFDKDFNKNDVVISSVSSSKFDEVIDELETRSSESSSKSDEVIDTKYRDTENRVSSLPFPDQEMGRVVSDKKKRLEEEKKILRKQQKEKFLAMDPISKNLHAFLKTDRPIILEPYMAYWNLFAAKYNLPKVTTATELRQKKLEARLKEPKFVFTQIISVATNSTIATSGTWFTFDWILEGEKNYIKVLEGNYIPRDSAIGQNLQNQQPLKTAHIKRKSAE